MEMRAGGGHLGRATRERLDWLAGLCLLSWREEQILALLIGPDGDEPARRWWSPQALAERMGASAGEHAGHASLSPGDETVVAAALAAGAPLTEWGLVRSDGARVTVNLRIARFLLG